ncbi:MAG: glycerophosphodiester phosphodiesterase family protein [Pirellulales bacterium]
MSSRRIISLVRLVSLLCVILSWPGAMQLRADLPTVWNFDNAAVPLAAAIGPGVLSYRDPGGTGWGPASTQFGTASSFGLPLLPGGDSGVMRLAATTPQQGYTVTHNTPANGTFIDQGYVSNYTLVWDIYWPSASDAAYRAFYQTSTANANDAEFFALNAPSGGIGIGGNYHGSLTPDTWHRVAVVVRAAAGEGQMHKYIDGVFVGGQGTTGSGIDGRWALEPDVFHVFTDNDNETRVGYLSSMLYVDRNLSMDEIIGLGGPHAGGANVSGSIAPLPPPAAPHRVEIISHRGNSCCAPENTLAAIDAAFNAGASHMEIDVRLTADGVAVLMHDDALDRTTNGTGNVASMTLAQLKQVDAGSWFGPDFAGTTVPTLAEALQTAAGRGRLLLDVKVDGMGAALQQALVDAGADHTAIWPWRGSSTTAAGDFQANIPDVEILWGGVPSSLTTAAFDALKALGVVGFDVGLGSVTPAFVDAAHANGMYASAYTILDPPTMLQAINLGLDAMETDFPAVLDALMPQFGDANRDGGVDRQDAALLAANFGRTGDAVWANGNFDLPYQNDRAVTLADLARLQGRLSAAAPASRTASVPEPASLTLMILGAVILSSGRFAAGRSSCRRQLEPATGR